MNLLFAWADSKLFELEIWSKHSPYQNYCLSLPDDTCVYCSVCLWRNFTGFIRVTCPGFPAQSLAREDVQFDKKIKPKLKKMEESTNILLFCPGLRGNMLFLITWSLTDRYFRVCFCVLWIFIQFIWNFNWGPQLWEKRVFHALSTNANELIYFLLLNGLKFSC